MIRRRVRGFLARRLSSEEHLGLHLTIGLLVCLLLVGLFGFLAHSVVGEQALTEFDQRVGRDLEANREHSPHLRHTMIVFTEIGSPEAMTGLTMLVALGLLMRRRRPAGAGLAAGHDRDAAAQPRPEIGLRPRPAPLPRPHHQREHTQLPQRPFDGRRHRLRPADLLPSPGALGSAGKAGRGRDRGRAGGHDRLQPHLPRAHYFSDVVGGFAVGGAWLSVCISGAEAARRRQRHRHRKAPDPPPDQPPV